MSHRPSSCYWQVLRFSDTPYVQQATTFGVDPKSIVESLDTLDKCSRAVLDWFTNNGLALNPSKSEVLFMGTRTKLHSVRNIAKVSVTGCDISPAESIKNLGVTLDSELSLCKHVSNICKTSHYHIRALRHIRQSVDFETAKTIGCAIVGSRLDYCNSILYGTSAENLKKLQTVQNALARVVSGKRKYDRITPTLIDLHWLPVAHRINFKLATMVYKTKIHHQPEYLEIYSSNTNSREYSDHLPTNSLPFPALELFLQPGLSL